MLFDADGAVHGIAQYPVVSTYPRPGWVNQDADHVWQVTLRAAREALASSGTPAGRIAGIGITNQRETTFLWERATGRPVAPGIVWQSRQSAPVVAEITARGMAETYRRITGLVPDAYFSATKVAWLLDRDPELRRRAEAGDICFGTSDSWLMWNLSGGREHLTDYSNASRTMLFDIHQLCWSDELLADLSIPRAMLPKVRPNSGVLFETVPDLLGGAMPVAGVAGDQQAALFGQVCFNPGEVKNTYGTGSFLVMQTGPEAVTSHNGLLTTIAWKIGERLDYALEGAILVSGAAVQWLRDGLAIIRQAADIEPLAASVPDSDGVVFVPALTGLGAPYWDSDARGTILGITRGTTAAHIARATLDAIAFQSRDVLDTMQSDTGITVPELRVDGGAAVDDLLMQIQADLLGIPVVRPANIETTALGAAYLAGLATGVWRNQEDIRSHWHADRRFTPRLDVSERESRYATWKRAVERARGWAG
jgi:glycerol kinase